MVREQIDSLPEQQRELVTLRDMCELTYEEIATQTGLTLTNIRTTISRARKTLKTILTEKMR
jgi:RNA polymerase sigma-70 factor (ECF subfamily)